MRELIKKLANKFGYEVRRIKRDDEVIPKPISDMPIDVFDLVVKDLVSKKADIFFIEIGAHDGLHYDPIRPYVKQHHWRGILIEPQPKIFARLVENYKDEPQLLFENAAIAAQDGTFCLYTFEESPDLPDHATMLASFNRAALEHNAHGYQAPIQETIVPAISTGSLFSKHNITQVDLLQIDTEGYDWEILKMFDFAKYLPAIVHFESAGLDADETADCFKLLEGHGYRILTLGIDTIAYQQEVDAEFVGALDITGRR